jgi:hypothetical protein
MNDDVLLGGRVRPISPYVYGPPLTGSDTGQRRHKFVHDACHPHSLNRPRVRYTAPTRRVTQPGERLWSGHWPGVIRQILFVRVVA